MPPKKKYIKIHCNEVAFLFAMDEVDGERIPHIQARRGLFPDDAINTYFNITKEIFNIHYRRWEAYSEYTDLGLYYCHIDSDNTVLIMSLFYPDKAFYKKLKLKIK